MNKLFYLNTIQKARPSTKKSTIIRSMFASTRFLYTSQILQDD